MIIDRPTPEQLPQLRLLWQQAFGDTDAFLDSFFRLAFSYDRCRCLSVDGQVAAMLFWFDCTCQRQKQAYLYAVATDAAYQNRGFCRALMENTHIFLQESGYWGAILVPGSRELFRLYEKLGYRTATYIREFTAQVKEPAVALREIGMEEFAALRRQMLPKQGVVQEGATLALLQATGRFYTADGLLLAATQAEGKLVCSELLGPAEAAIGILQSLGISQGRFRSPGGDIPFAMFHPLREDAIVPAYFGLALD